MSSSTQARAAPRVGDQEAGEVARESMTNISTELE
jgi:hypothetical protein